jgi:hypothetical protein
VWDLVSCLRNSPNPILLEKSNKIRREMNTQLLVYADDDDSRGEHLHIIKTNIRN